MKKKKVGILTFHDADNLGAVLQAYALNTVLEKECGVTAEIINYKCPKITSTKYATVSASIKGMIKYFLMLVYYKIKRCGFDSFRKKRLNLSEGCNRQNIEEITKDYDLLIAGSDQVWNPECTDSDKTYLLDFVGDRNCKYSYAASLGNREFSPADDMEWINGIKDFREISVREQSAAQHLEKLGIGNVRVNSDPVVLLSEDEWKKIMSKRLVSQKYVLVYTVLPDVNVMNAAKNYAIEHNCKLISNKKSIEFILHNSPSDFLSWIYHAECVFTNSFHGTAFSVIFGKKLFADTEMTGGKINNRVNDFLLATSCVACSDPKTAGVTVSADSESKLEEMKKNSTEYLKEICR